MVALSELVLPILLSAVFVFIVSSLLHMVIPHHRSDHAKLPDEAGILERMRASNVSPGSYLFPFPSSMKEMGSPEMQEKYQKGPVGFMTLLPNGPPAMGKNLGLWFIYTLIVSFFVAYLGSLSIQPSADAAYVFRITATIAILAYSVASMVDSIWKGVAWSVTCKFMFDGLCYALATAATFAWLWPAG